ALSDGYGSSLLSPLFPILAERLHLTLAMVGSLPMMIGLSASLAQPLLGLLSDRYPQIPMVALGPAIGALFCGLVGAAPNYRMLLVFLFIAGIGNGVFHPQGARLAREAGKGSGLAMSGFTVGGNIGFGLAPLLGACYYRFLGLEGWYYTALPGVLLAVVIALAFRHTYSSSPKEAPPSSTSNGGNPRALAFLTLSVMLRALIPVSMTAYLPFYVQQNGLPGVDVHTAKAIVVAALLLSGGIAGPIGGHLSDRVGRRRVMIGSFLVAPWPLLASFHLPGYVGVAALVLGGFILLLPHPGNVVMAQEFMPHRAGVAASMITGLAWGLAVLFAMPLGAIADHVGVSAMLQGVCLVQLLGALVVLPIPERAD
ncbi:MAG: MFS transporter, partial [Armatimonadetes bacterium]|nr:MFS transporter [Armatimonadota bacterium]